MEIRIIYYSDSPKIKVEIINEAHDHTMGDEASALTDENKQIIRDQMMNKLSADRIRNYMIVNFKNKTRT